MSLQMQQHEFRKSADEPQSIAGADGCPDGWVIATRRGVSVVSAITASAQSVLGIDMPIGLPEAGPRSCDVEARKFLGPRRSSVFPTPPRVCLGARDHSEAVVLARKSTGVGISIQAFHLLPKIAQIDRAISADDERRILEVHPECSFAVMNGGVPLSSKKSAEGVALRTSLLTARFGTLPPRPRGARIDDLLDAYAVLWSTERFVAGTARVFGDGERDARGLLMRIIA